jgi:ubiquinone/menaquinone biosynthesis C-methylase UbiE
MMREKKFIPALKYDWLTKIYDPLIQATMPEDKFKNALVDQASIEPNSYVLDFGCGSLTLSLKAKKKVPAAYVHAVDVDEKILKIAAEKLRVTGEEIFIQRYEGRVLPYPSQTFDRIISSLVFHHLDKDQKLNSLYEIFRVLKPGGELHIADWGKAKNGLMRSAFFMVQLLDGFKTTTDNVNGLLPKYIAQAGFKEVVKTKEFQTIFGTLTLYKAIKPKSLTVL